MHRCATSLVVWTHTRNMCRCVCLQDLQLCVVGVHGTHRDLTSSKNRGDSKNRAHRLVSQVCRLFHVKSYKQHQLGCTSNRLHMNYMTHQLHDTSSLHINYIAHHLHYKSSTLHNNTQQLQYTTTTLHINHSAHQPQCTSIVVHMNHIANQSHCTSITLHVNHIAHQSHCTSITVRVNHTEHTNQSE